MSKSKWVGIGFLVTLGLGGPMVLNAINGGESTTTGNSNPASLPPMPNKVETQKLTPLEQSYVAPDGTIGWIELELTDDAINKVTVMDANSNKICSGFQYRQAVHDYDRDHDVRTDGVADHRVRVTEQGIIEKFCGINGYLFFKTPDTSNWHQSYDPSSENFAALLEKSIPVVFGYVLDTQTWELSPLVMHVLPEDDVVFEIA